MLVPCSDRTKSEVFYVTGMKSFITLSLLTVCLLLVDWTEGRGKRIINFRHCSPRLMSGVLFGPHGCSTRVSSFACQGYCKSETVSRTDRKELNTFCNCCVPVEFQFSTRYLICGRSRIQYKIPYAVKCACQRCQSAIQRVS